MDLLDRVWTRERARLAGISRQRLTGGREFVRVVRGHYLEACWADDLASRCAAVVVAVPGAVVSHWTALELVGVPVPLGRSGELHVSTTRGGNPRLVGVAVHRQVVPPAPLVLGGTTGPRDDADDPAAAGPSAVLPVSGPGRAWCDSATLLPRCGDLGDLVAAADVLLARDPDLVGPVRAYLRTRRGDRGVALARTALRLVDGRAESPQESRLRVALRLAGLRPAVQHEVVDGRGRFVARVDLAFPALRVAVEYDGDHHRTDRRQWRHDLLRRERLEAAGWTVVVVTAADLRRPDRVVARVRAALARRRTESAA